MLKHCKSYENLADNKQFREINLEKQKKESQELCKCIIIWKISFIYECKSGCLKYN